MDSLIVAALIGAAAGVLGTLATLWATKRARTWELRDKKWDEIFSSLERIDQLAGEHIRKIDEVVKPILRTGNLLETCEKYGVFVNDPTLPTGYGAARGVLMEAYNDFRSGPIHEKLKLVIQELHEFQQIGFLLKLSSWAIADSMDHACDLWKDLDRGGKIKSEKLRDQVYEKFQKALREIRSSLDKRFGADYYILTDVPPSLGTADDVIQIIKIFCREWQRSAEITLYGRRGLHYAIGELKYALRNA